jgi:hypothetical protein
MVQLFEIEAFSVYWLLRRGRLDERTKRLSAHPSASTCDPIDGYPLFCFIPLPRFRVTRISLRATKIQHKSSLATYGTSLRSGASGASL